jgi:hypothetical protein
MRRQVFGPLDDGNHEPLMAMGMLDGSVQRHFPSKGRHRVVVLSPLVPIFSTDEAKGSTDIEIAPHFVD